MSDQPTTAAAAGPAVAKPSVLADLGQVLAVPAVWVAALGYFVDVFDMSLFSVVRVESLLGLGVEADRIRSVGAWLFQFQMGGMLLGGFLWGILGDKRGRISVLFGSILLYSLANLANALVTDLHTYAALRFLAGVGLAGELGAAITLVSEILPRRTRGYGTAIVATLGLSGAIAAALVGKLGLGWRNTYALGGCLGLLLLFARARLHESGIFSQLASTPTRRGELSLLFGTFERGLRFVRCVLVGVPIWCVTGIFVIFAPELARALGATGAVTAGDAIMYHYIGGVSGDLASGLLSQWLGSRRKVVAGFLAFLAAGLLGLGLSSGLTPGLFYFFIFLLGLGNGYFALFATLTAEQFGTNLRATAATTAPNLVRGAAVPITALFEALNLKFPGAMLANALALSAASLLLGSISLATLRETFGKDLDYVES